MFVAGCIIFLFIFTYIPVSDTQKKHITVYRFDLAQEVMTMSALFKLWFEGHTQTEFGAGSTQGHCWSASAQYMASSSCIWGSQSLTFSFA